MTRLDCNNCGSETEFVQFGGANSPSVATTESEAGDGLLELRMCNKCGNAIENVLTLDHQNNYDPTEYND